MEERGEGGEGGGVCPDCHGALPFSGGHSVAGRNTVVDTGSEMLPDFEYVFEGRGGLTCDKRV